MVVSAEKSSLENPSAESRPSIISLLYKTAAEHGISIRLGDEEGDDGKIYVQRGVDLFIVRSDHLIYAGDLINQFDYYFSSTVSTSKDGLRVIDYSEPAWHELPSGERMFYTSFAEDVGATEDYLAYLRPSSGETVLDIGAYCGYSVLAFSRAVGPLGKVIAFEPDPKNFAALEKNVRETQAGNVVLRNAALSSSSGPLLFSSEGNMGSAIVGERSDRGETIEIRSERLRLLFESGEIGSFDVAKVDIEGAEYSLLEDSIDVIRKTKARWAIELHADPVTKEGVDVDRVRSIFDHLGYLSYLQPASSTAAAPTLFTFPDDRFPAALEDRPARNIAKQRLYDAEASLARQDAAYKDLELAYKDLELAYNRRLGSFGHRLRFLLVGK